MSFTGHVTGLGVAWFDVKWSFGSGRPLYTLHDRGQRDNLEMCNMERVRARDEEDLGGMGRSWEILGGFGRYGEDLGGMGRIWVVWGKIWEVWGGFGRYGEDLGGMGRIWEVWGGFGRYSGLMEGWGRLGGVGYVGESSGRI